MRICALQVGDVVNVDVTAYYKGYHGDLNETFVVGEVDEESKKLTKVAYEVQFWHFATRHDFAQHHYRSAQKAYPESEVQVAKAIAAMC